MQVSKTCKFPKLSSCQLSPVVCQLSLVVSCLQLSAVSSCQLSPDVSLLQLSASSSCQLSPAFSCLQFSAVSSCQLSPCSTSCRFILSSQSCVHIICSEEYHWTMNRSLRLRCRRSEVSTTVLQYTEYNFWAQDLKF